MQVDADREVIGINNPIPRRDSIDPLIIPAILISFTAITAREGIVVIHYCYRVVIIVVCP